MTRVKICGVGTVEHALAAAEAGADFVGIVFAASRRRVEVSQARVIADAVRDLGSSRPSLVGVFAKQSAAEVIGMTAAVRLDYVQLHDPSPALCRQIEAPLIVAVGVDEYAEPQAIVERLRRLRIVRPDALLLLDAAVAGRSGGTGVSFDWVVARYVARQFPIFLAGGLTPANVVDAIRLVQPDGVDVSSGVETNGVKDVAKIVTFIAAVRALDNVEATSGGG